MRKEFDVMIFADTQVYRARATTPSRTAALLAAYTNPDLSVAAIDGSNPQTVDRWTQLAGFSVMTWKDMENLPDAIFRIKQACPSILTVVGGRYPTLYPAKVFEMAPHVDIVVRGNAEKSWEQITYEVKEAKHLNPAQRNKTIMDRLAGFPGIYQGNMKLNGELSMSPYLPLRQVKQPVYTVHKPPVPEYFKEYREKPWTALHADGRNLKVLTHLGCLKNCTFCVNTAFIGLDKNRPVVEHRMPVQVVEEIKTLLQLADVPKLSIHFGGPDSFQDPDKLDQTLKLIINEGLGQKLAIAVDATVENYVRAIDQNHPVFSHLKAAGVWRVILGVESLSDQVQQYINKQVSFEDIYRSIQKAAEIEVIPIIEIIIGLLPDSDQTLEESLDKLLALRDNCSPFPINVHTARAYPGTIYYSDALFHGLITEDAQIPASLYGESTVPTLHLTTLQVTEWARFTNEAFYTADYLKRIASDPRPGLLEESIRRKGNI